MNRRTLLMGAPAAALSAPWDAQAQPLPVISDVVPPRTGPGPLPAGAPWGISLDLGFMNPGTLDPRLTFTRASTATYFDSTGTLQTAAANAPRWDYDPVTHVLRGLFIEEARTNVLLNTATLGTQSVTVAAVPYTLSFYGTGTVTLSGTSTAGPLTGTGAFPQRVSLTFTPTAGTLTCTVTGSVLNAQLEAGPFPTSYIPTTAAAVTRAVDVCTMPTAAWFNAAASSLAAEFMMPYVPNPVGTVREICGLNGGSTSNLLCLRALIQPGSTSLFYSVVSGSSAVSTAVGTVVANSAMKIAAAWNGATPRGAMNGGAIVSYSQAMPGSITTLAIGNNVTGQTGVTDGYIRRVRYWPRALSNSELQSVTR